MKNYTVIVCLSPLLINSKFSHDFEIEGHDVDQVGIIPDLLCLVEGWNNLACFDCLFVSLSLITQKYMYRNCRIYVIFHQTVILSLFEFSFHTIASTRAPISATSTDWYIDGLAQDCSIPIAKALEIQQSCSEPSIPPARWVHLHWQSLRLYPLQWRHNGCNDVSNHQPLYCLFKRLFRRRSKKTSKLRVTGLCAWNSPVTGEFPAQMSSNAENVSIWGRHHER